MKKFYLISWIVFIAGVVLKVFNVEGGNIITLLGSTLIVLHALIYIIRHIRNIEGGSKFYLGVALLNFYITLHILFQPFANYVFIPAVIISLFTQLDMVRKKEGSRVRMISLCSLFTISVLVYFTSASRFLYLFKLDPTLHGESRKTDFQAWDKYSWFLYHKGKKEDGLEANSEALSAYASFIQMRQDPANNNINDDGELLGYDQAIKRYRELMNQDRWLDFEDK